VDRRTFIGHAAGSLIAVSRVVDAQQPPKAARIGHRR
jgi:hypothetical protein